MRQTTTTILRILRLYAIALWVGGLVFFVAVAQVAFNNLPTPHEAGMVVRGSLLAIHHIGIVAGLVYLLATIALRFLNRRSPGLYIAESLLVIAMLLLTFYSKDSIIPRMERDRLALGGEVTDATKASPEHLDFDRLHSVSTKVEGGVLFCGLVVVALAAVPTNREPNH
jgi:putative copper export protein